MPSVVKLTLESNQYEKGMRQAQKSWNEFMKGIGLSMSKFTAAGAAVGAVTGALKVAKDAFFKNEQQLDEWGRVVQSSQSLYSSFLNTLNSGDFSGFFHNIDNVVKAARSAYNAIDELATYNAFNRMNVADARANMSEAIGAYRMGNGSKEDVQSAVSNLKKELTVRQEKEWAAYIESVRSMAIDRNANPDDVVKLLGGSYVDFENVKKSWKPASYTKKNVLPMFGSGTVSGAMMGVNFGTRVSQTPGSDEERLANFARTLNDTELDKLQAMGEQAKNTKREIADLDKQLARVLNGRQPGTGSGGSGSGGGGRSRGGGGNKPELTEMQQNQQTINTLTQEYVRISDNANEGARQRQDEIRKEIQLLEQRNNLIKLYQEQAQGKLLGGDVQTTGLGSGSFAGSFKDMKIEGLDEETMEKVREGMAKMNQTANESKQSFGLAANAAGALGSALAGIDDPGARAAGIVLQSIASIAMGFAAASASPAVTGTGWGWLAFLGAGLAALATTISTVHQLTGFAEGGIVGGNQYSGDNIYAGNAMVNSGELVLNKAQQGNLASQLQGNGIRNMNISGRIKGTDIILSVDRSLQLQGKQLLTWG